MTKLQVPFVENPNTRCVPACVAMVLAYFMPERIFSMPDVEKLCGFRPGPQNGTWPMEHWLRLTEMGFEVRVIEEFDLAKFAEDPRAYLASIIKDPEALAFQTRGEGLDKEAGRARDFLARGLPHENRQGTVEDIKQFLDDGWLVRLEVDACTLANQPGYEGHSVLAIGYNDDDIILHNPDGRFGNKPNQHVPWPHLVDAWRNMGGSFALNAYRR
jgi:hypothetical protein